MPKAEQNRSRLLKREREIKKPPLKGRQRKPARSRPPSLAEVKEWAAAEGWPIDAERFVAFYASNGWKVGKNPMRDWRAAAEGWCRRDGLKRRGEAKRKAWATCPKCGARMFKNTQSGRWDCPGCLASFDRGAVA